MAQIISIIGVSGVGKTSLVRALNPGDRYAIGLESHTERPFQALFKKDPKYCLANQVDFLLYRAEQERLLRADVRPALIDGGLDLDFQAFTRLFHARGWLQNPEFQLLERLYQHIRITLPRPDILIYLYASDEAIENRLASRDRINIASASDKASITAYIDEWLKTLPKEIIHPVDVTHEPLDFSTCLPGIQEFINKHLVQNARGGL